MRRHQDIQAEDLVRGKGAGETKEALRQGEMRFRELADNISQFAWMADETGSLFWYNQRWYDYTGTSLEQMRGWGWQAVHHPEHVARVTEKIQSGRCRRRAMGRHFSASPQAGRVAFLSRARPNYDESGLLFRWFGTNTDITEQLETERKLRSANRDLEQFAFSASHDPQEPLRNVAVYTQLLQERSCESLDEHGSKRMAGLISDLLVYTQAATSEDEPVSPVDAEQVFCDVLESFSGMLQETGAIVPHDLLPRVASQEIHLQQLLQNLLGNAIKYHKDGEAPRDACFGGKKRKS